MAARDRYSFRMTCPICKRADVIAFSEDDHPYMKADTQTVDGKPAWVTVHRGPKGEEPWCAQDDVALVSVPST